MWGVRCGKSRMSGQTGRGHVLLDYLVHVERVGPVLLVPKGIEAEDLLALGDGT